ncbi:tryptophan synthase subunit alpha [Corynebacterium amycolatum]|uniref:Tryptophan synthase alpha chain n=2 Tax=Corynebacterium TaxID=1716 RepID=A0AB37GG85_CORAY|nr:MULTISPECIES: tryptophan synthase subunit alpha [Corynebacterium]MBC6829828.1 tryptophan synthase subunit alpha [Corynebacterium sp. LK32]MCQ9126319.1 tryptophan synthase subunit alpha [Corynebacterium amycolatum]MCQ9128552.1 tryptophan synthase subunit alpha [Corynebacterium amycolatum]MCQ9142745.1 tryptophan synthase subunit alpha [Corynebacterium amycolatum]MDU3111349.1 tryptophan synthase subunit alpha [Corynebacterium sp.]
MSLSDVFDKVREENRAAFIGYYPAGFPTTDKSIENIKAIVDAGADIIEVGLPFSDPMMDGPTIQDAANVALDAGFRTREIMCVVREVTEYGGTCVVMSYWNPILQYGPERFAKDLAAAGGRGTIIPDLIPEEAGQWQRAAEANGLSNIMLVAPSSTNERLQLTATASTGFVYATSHMGVTGAQASVDSAAGKLVARTREVTDTPVCVGLGVSNGEQAAEIAEFADGVIVGSALIKAAMKSTDDLVTLARELAAGVRGES